MGDLTGARPGPAESAWERLRQVLEANAITFDVDPLVSPALAVGLHTSPIIGLVIGAEGDVEVQVQRAVAQWFPHSDLQLLASKTVPELIAAVRASEIINDVERDKHGRIRRAWTSFAGIPPTGFGKRYEARFSRHADTAD